VEVSPPAESDAFLPRGATLEGQMLLAQLCGAQTTPLADNQQLPAPQRAAGNG
jgi:hypothetical protein